MIRTLAIVVMVLVQSSSAQSADEEWIEAGDPVRHGDVEVRIEKLGIANVPLNHLGRSSESEDKLFVILLKITNLSSTKKVHYEGWASRS
jgi:hypothetical protein